MKTKANKYLNAGYQRLLGYQKPDGGFGYWANDSANLALTAYALRFLTEADEFIEVDEEVLDKTNDFLIRQQRADGSWTQTYSWEKQEDLVRTKQITAYIARILAVNATIKDDTDSAKKALSYLKTRLDEIDDPYFLASFALASLAVSDNEMALKTAEKLRKLAKSESTGVYWNLETNTPFYGWGYAGKIETSAVVLQVLVKAQAISRKDADTQREEQPTNDDELISSALQYLLKAKDRYGVWYSTQATINVLDALILALATETKNQTADSSTAEIFLNGAKIQTLNLPKANEIVSPIFVALPNLNPTTNRLEVRQNKGAPFTLAQVVTNHYVGWQNSNNNGFSSNDSRGLRLKVDFDRTNAAIMQEITCRVEAERIGFQGYGMLLAEIGLPPGADVDRESLEKVMQENRSVSRYDVLPDKISYCK